MRERGGVSSLPGQYFEDEMRGLADATGLSVLPLLRGPNRTALSTLPSRCVCVCVLVCFLFPNKRDSHQSGSQDSQNPHDRRADQVPRARAACLTLQGKLLDVRSLGLGHGVHRVAHAAAGSRLGCRRAFPRTLFAVIFVRVCFMLCNQGCQTLTLVVDLSFFSTLIWRRISRKSPCTTLLTLTWATRLPTLAGPAGSGPSLVVLAKSPTDESGISSVQMAISEIGVSFPDETFGKESRFGIPFTYILRDIIQFDQVRSAVGFRCGNGAHYVTSYTSMLPMFRMLLLMLLMLLVDAAGHCHPHHRCSPHVRPDSRCRRWQGWWS